MNNLGLTESNTYGRLVQIVDGYYYDGFGNPLDIGASIGTSGNGSSGVNGLNGSSGSSGETGSSGSSGETGSSGSSGGAGSSGKTGTSGSSGSSGVTPNVEPLTEVIILPPPDDINKIFYLTTPLTVGSQHMFFINGQLLTYGEDYDIVGTTLTIYPARPAPEYLDVLRLFGSVGTVMIAGSSGSSGSSGTSGVSYMSIITTLGDIIYGDYSGNATVLPGNTSPVQMVLTQTGNSIISGTPSWEVYSGGSGVTASLQQVIDVNKVADRVVFRKIFYNQGTFLSNYFYGLYFVDIEVVTGGFFVYGSFTSYDGVSTIELVKLFNNGTIDTSFAPPTSVNDIVYSSYTIFLRSDNKLLVGGGFTNFNGYSYNRLVLLNSNGSVDTGFNIGGGFNGYTTNIKEAYDGKLYVGGQFTNFNGNSAVRIVRISATGSHDPSFVTGTGFNNAVTFILPNPDGTLYVAGYFSTYNGSSAPHIIKLLENGSVDTSFNPGTGFTIPQLVVISMVRLVNGSILVYSSDNNNIHFSTYNGTSANKIVALLSNGSIDTSFIYGTGFDRSVNHISVDSNNRLLITGSFTTYNGHNVISNSVVLNQDGSIYKYPDALGSYFEHIFQNSDGNYIGLTENFNLLNNEFIIQNDKVLSFSEVTGRAEYNIEHYSEATDYELLNKKIIKLMIQDTWIPLTGTVSGYVSAQGSSDVTKFLNGSGSWSSISLGTSGSSGLSNGTSGSSGSAGSSGVNGSFFGTSGSSGTGTSGTSGYNGTSGSSGRTGTSGSSGLAGINGSSGSSGLAGINGSSGSSGLTGTSGVNGDFLGTSGSSGLSGINGSSGSSGRTGTSGVNGVNGSSGSSGLSGINGSSGSSGSGSPGVSGTSGVNGSFFGTSGTSGVNGVNGSSGSSGSGSPGSSGSSGRTGTSGVNGVNGSSGSSGSGSPGSSGSSGRTGTSGVNGVNGSSGSSGSGSPGSSGSSGRTGTSGVNGVNGSSGSSGVSVSISGTSGRIVKFTSASTIGNSTMSDDGTNVTATGTITATDFIGSSDLRLKENIEELVSIFINTDYKSFNFKDNAQKRIGVMAQELEVNHPEFIRIDDNGMKSVSYIDLHSAEIAYLKDRVLKLEELVNKLIVK